MNKSSISSLATLNTGTSFETESLHIYTDNTFAYQMDKALELRSKGHFNDAMLVVGTINRDQVLAIREIQEVLDIESETPPKYVIFEKFKQTEPFEIGIKDGDTVLDLIKEVEDTESTMYIGDIHKHESDYAAAFDEYNFYRTRMKGKVSDDELEDMFAECTTIQHDLEAAKLSLIEHIEEKIQSQTIKDPVNLAKLVRSLYRVITSSIETLHADNVDAEIVEESV